MWPVIMSPELTAWLSSLAFTVGRDKDRDLISWVPMASGPSNCAGLVVGAEPWTLNYLGSFQLCAFPRALLGRGVGPTCFEKPLIPE